MSLDEFLAYPGVNSVFAKKYYSSLGSSILFPIGSKYADFDPELVKNNFQKNRDYTISNNNYYLSLEAFKLYLFIKEKGGSQERNDLLLVEKMFALFTKERLIKETLKCKEQEQRIMELEYKLTNKYVPGERVYVMKNDLLDTSSAFKIGRTKDLQKRIGNYNTSASAGGVCIVFEKLCCDSKLIEAMIHFVLDKFRSEKNHEYFHCDIKLITKTINHCIEACDGFRNSIGQEDSPFDVENSESSELELEIGGSENLGSPPETSSYFKKFKFTNIV